MQLSKQTMPSNNVKQFDSKHKTFFQKHQGKLLLKITDDTYLYILQVYFLCMAIGHITGLALKAKHILKY